MISVIVPIYNVERFVPTTVKSLLRQKGNPVFEVILVDDGSTDGSPDLCDKFASEHANIRVVHKPNGGLSSARNAGIEASLGDYLLFLDGDDCLDSIALSSLVSAASNHPECDVIQFRYEEVKAAVPFGHKVAKELQGFRILSDEQEFFQQLCDLGGVAASACTKLIKRTTLGDLRFKEGIIHEDEYFTTRLLSRCKHIGYCTNEFYKYAMREGSIQHSGFSKKRLDSVRVREDRVSYLKSKGFSVVESLFTKQLLLNIHLLWVDAYEAGDLESCRWLEGKLKQYSQATPHPLLVLKHDLKKALKPAVVKLRNAKVKYDLYRLHRERRKQLAFTDFSIISNNCWGGLVYQYFGLPYTSPMVGLFIMDDDYIRFLERLDYYLAQPLKFISINESRYKDQLQHESTAKIYYPIALLDDVEVHFLHYYSEQEAQEKWAKRLERLNRNRLLVKMSQRSTDIPDLLDRFEALPFPNKICFTEHERTNPIFVTIPELRQLNIQGGDETPFVMDKVDFVEMINSIK